MHISGSISDLDDTRRIKIIEPQSTSNRINKMIEH